MLAELGGVCLVVVRTFLWSLLSLLDAKVVKPTLNPKEQAHLTSIGPASQPLRTDIRRVRRGSDAAGFGGCP